MSRVVIFNHAGTPIKEFRATVNREWLRNDMGEGSLKVSRFDSVATEEYLRFGNRVVVYHEYLPEWGGYIDTPREWDDRGNIKVSLYSVPGLLSWRRTPDRWKVRGTPGDRFWQLIEHANARKSLGIVRGSIDQEGEAVTSVLETENVLEAMKDLAEETGFTFWFTPLILSTGELQWQANWRDVTKGRDLTHRHHLRSGVNIVPNNYPYVEDGTIVNDLLALGKVDGTRSKVESTAIDEASISLYDVREGIEDVDSDYEGKLSEAASAMIKDLAYPAKTVDVLIPRDLTNAETLAMMKELSLDNLYSLSMGEVSFTGLNATVRVSGFGYNESDSQTRLILEVI